MGMSSQLLAESHLKSLETEGYLIIDELFDEVLLERLRADVDLASQECCQIQQQKAVGTSVDSSDNPLGGDGALGGAAHHAICFGDSFQDLLENRPAFELINDYLGGKFILNSFGAVTNTKSNSMYEHGMIVHRDTRSFHPTYRQMLWMFVMVDDFTAENGATHILPRSHDQEFQPSEEIFAEKSIQAEGKAGSILLVDGRLWHASGKNMTTGSRRILTLAFTLPYVKPQMDYVRYFGVNKVKSMSDNLKQLYGYYSRIPCDFEEWYSPPEERFYQSSQG